MQRALDEARQALKEGEIPIGAVVVCKDRIIARAHNLTEFTTFPYSTVLSIVTLAVTLFTLLKKD